MAEHANHRTRQSPPRDAFPQLFDEYYRPIVRFFTRRGFPPEESRDLAQETFLRAYKGLGQYRGEAGIQSWLFSIAANLLRNTLREQQAEKRSGEEVPLDTVPAESAEASRPLLHFVHHDSSSPLEGLLVRERSRQLRRAVEGLPPRMRRCVTLRLDQELAYRDIALLLQISEETVKAQLFQARRRLHRALAERNRQELRLRKVDDHG